jgi:hypothetical protein
MDLVDLKDEIEKLNRETLPKLDLMFQTAISRLANEFHAVVERLDGATITVTITLPPRKQ